MEDSAWDNRQPRTCPIARRRAKWPRQHKSGDTDVEKNDFAYRNLANRKVDTRVTGQSYYDEEDN
jgi:hypothetical protein